MRRAISLEIFSAGIVYYIEYVPGLYSSTVYREEQAGAYEATEMLLNEKNVTYSAVVSHGQKK